MKITKAVREALRRELAAKQYAPPDIALVMVSRYGVRPRLALRWAYGMTLDDVAEAWNQRDGSGRAPMSPQRVSDYERWPDGGKRPTAYALLMLARIYAVPVERLVDQRDFAALGDKQLFEVIELCQTVAGPVASGETRPDAPAKIKEASAKRRHVIQLGGAAVGDHVLDLLSVEPDRLHAALDASTVSEERLIYLEQVADRLGAQFVNVKPPTLLEDAVTYFRSVRRLVKDHQKTAYQLRLSRVGAKLGMVVGEILFIEGQFDLAAEWYRAAEHAALAGGDRYLADLALGDRAYLPTYAGDPSGVLALVDPRLEQRCRPTPAVAWLWAFKGKAHATLADRTAFERALSRARTVLEASPIELNSPGLFSFPPEKLEFYEATGYVRLGDAEHAAQAADRALALYEPTENTITPALVRLDKASALAQAGEVPEACQVATRALLDPHTYHAVSIVIRAREFDALLGDDRAPAVREWREVLATIRRPPPATAARPVGPSAVAEHARHRAATDSPSTLGASPDS
ncbi:MAG: helix-turn-helix domain-containing protein [Egibacteraceae bacterium]